MWLHVAEAGRALMRGLVELLYPSACALCGRPPGEDEAGAFCAACRSALTDDPHPACPHCAGSIGPFAAVEEGCVNCRTESFAFERAVRLGAYDGLLRVAVLRMKHQTGEALAERIGELWADHARAQLATLSADVVVPVPLYWVRRLRRGYNQSAALARGLAAGLGAPLVSSCLRRTRHTPLQTLLPASARRTNVRGAFRARPHPALKHRTVLLVDDVVTTGSTASAAARALHDAGAGRVVVAALSRAVLD